jgi:Na+/melibiose symporter-like transporter
MLLFSLLLLWRYPLTAERMLEIKAELARRRNAAHA